MLSCVYVLLLVQTEPVNPVQPETVSTNAWLVSCIWLIACHVQVLYMTGWAPHASQQKPSRRGSATVSFEDLQEALSQQADKGEGRQQ